MALSLKDRESSLPIRCLFQVSQAFIQFSNHVSLLSGQNLLVAAATKKVGSVEDSQRTCVKQLLLSFWWDSFPVTDEVLLNLSADHYLVDFPGKGFPNPVNLEALCLSTGSQCLSIMFTYNQKDVRPIRWAAKWEVPCSVYNAHFSAQVFEGKIRLRIIHGSANSVSLINVFNFYLCLCIKSVTLESNNDIYMQNDTLEYDNQFCF